MSRPFRSLRAIRADLKAQEVPSSDADVSDHLRYIFHQGLAVMLSPWYWLGVGLAVAVAAVVGMVW